MTEETQQASENLVGLLPKEVRVLSKPTRRAATPALEVPFASMVRWMTTAVMT